MSPLPLRTVASSASPAAFACCHVKAAVEHFSTCNPGARAIDESDRLMMTRSAGGPHAPMPMVAPRMRNPMRIRSWIDNLEWAGFLGHDSILKTASGQEAGTAVG